ncbi:hypothetical protein HZA98_00655 [Candidatus Woesearchaeota archaeon]|nr:hypothetical protein [Candidatus Woesearchaeota archaeon]
MKKELFLFIFILIFITACSAIPEKNSTTLEINTSNSNATISESNPPSNNNEKEYFSFECPKQLYPPIIEGKIHVVYTAISSDGIHWTEEGFVTQGSVPEAFVFNNKYYLVVMSPCIMQSSSDGKTFTPYTYKLKGSQNLGVDPTVLVKDGRIHLYVYEPGEKTLQQDPASLAGKHSIVEYSSQDAIHWKREGEVIAKEAITDPDIVFYKEIYYLYLSQGQGMEAATAADGKTFQMLNNGNIINPVGGVGDSIVINDKIYSYVHRSAGTETDIILSTSTDGQHWQDEGVVLRDGEAPSVIKTLDGSYRMYYVKRISPEEYKP